MQILRSQNKFPKSLQNTVVDMQLLMPRTMATNSLTTTTIVSCFRTLLWIQDATSICLLPSVLPNYRCCEEPIFLPDLPQMNLFVGNWNGRKWQPHTMYTVI
jgi:hypothetical protein